MVTSRKPSKRPSMFEVAKLAGVSHQTVSRVINDSPDVSDATRARVQAAIDQLGYRPSNSARALASRRSRTIGLIAGGLKFFGPISSISSIESMAREHGLFMSVMMVHEALCRAGRLRQPVRHLQRAERRRLHLPDSDRRDVRRRLPCASHSAARHRHRHPRPNDRA